VSPRHAAPPKPRAQSSFTDALRVREFRWLWLAGAQSLVGDQLARVAIALLVFERTGSAAETALIYALTYLPAILGGVLLAGLADRFARRDVMIACDLARAPLLGVMAIPGIPTLYLGALLVIVVLLGAPFGAAHAAVLPQILDGERYVAGAGLRMFTDQVAQIFGFAFGGAIVAVFNSHWALAFDALTFLLSGLLVAVAVRRRPVDPAPVATRRSALARSVNVVESVRGTVGVIVGDARLWALLGLGWLAAFYVIPEGVAAPYAEALRRGPAAVGLLMASMPAGQAVGSWIFVRFYPDELRTKLVGPMAALAGVPLIGCLSNPGLAASIVLWALSGVACAYQVQAVSMFVRSVPDAQRGRVLGFAASGLLAVQGLGIVAGGVVGASIGMYRVVAIAGATGAVLALPLARVWTRALGAPVADLGDTARSTSTADSSGP
jgi:MFS family permease